MFYNGEMIVNLSREFIDSAGAKHYTKIRVAAVEEKNPFVRTVEGEDLKEKIFNNLQDPNLDPVAIQEISKIITFNPVTIGGKLFTSLANIRVDDLEKVNPNSEIYYILKNRGFDEDASVVMSALLSLSTDNAKELALPKLNATTNFADIYTYLFSLGCNAEEVGKIMTSKFIEKEMIT